MSRSQLYHWLVQVVAFGSMCAGLNACGGDGSGGSSGSPPPPIAVTVTGGGVTIDPGASIQVTAVVSHDASNRGVTWSVTCAAAPCGSISPATTGSGQAATYTAPAARPPSDLAVTILATAMADATAKGTASVNVAGDIAIMITSTSDNLVQVLPGTTKAYIATVENDTANAGVNWTLSCPTPPCGTVSPTITDSGAPTTYTPPKLPNGTQLDVGLTATSVSNPGISSALQVTVYGRFIILDSPQTIGAGNSVQISAQVYSDPANQDAAWALQCAAADCGSLSAPTSASGAPVTYTAPPPPVPADLNVTVTVSSVSHPDVQATTTITVAAVTVTVTPPSALMPLNSTQQFLGSLDWAATDGVVWQLKMNGTACGSACGKLSAAQTASLEYVTYTPPTVIPPSATTPPRATVSIVASSVADPTKSGSATVQLTNGTVKLVPMTLQVDVHEITQKGKRKCFAGQKTATLTNTGASPLTVSGFTIGGTNPTAFSQTNTCVTPLGAAQSCDITVKFNCSILGSATAVLSIADSSVDSPQQLTLIGHRTAAASVSASMREALVTRNVAATPAPTGSHIVGTRLASLANADYPDPYSSNGSARELMVRFWYPAVPTRTCTSADYTSPQIWSYFSELLGVALPQVSTHSCLDADVAPGLHPVVVLTHGFTGTFTDYTFLAEDLASRGYVVVSVNHTYEATATELSDGRLEKSLYGSHLRSYRRYDVDSLEQAVAVRLEDLRFVLDQLPVISRVTDGPFAGRLDLTRIALVGHSLGGLTTLRALAVEPRLKAGVVLDGAVSPRPLPPIRQQVLSIMAGDGLPDVDQCRMWAAVRGTPLFVRLPGVEHVALSDAVWLAGTALKTGNAAPDWVVSVIRRDVASFLDATLRELSTAQMAATHRARFPGDIVAAGAQPVCRAH